MLDVLLDVFCNGILSDYQCNRYFSFAEALPDSCDVVAVGTSQQAHSIGITDARKAALKFRFEVACPLRNRKKRN
jgi:hypothetical protein